MGWFEQTLITSTRACTAAIVWHAPCSARLGDADRTADAARRALAAYDMTETTEPALVQLDHATALAYAGEAEEACRIAADAISRPHTFYGATVSSRAGEFDALLSEIRAPRAPEWVNAY